MEFDRFLFLTKRLTLKEFWGLRKQQLIESLSGQSDDEQGFLRANLDDFADLASVREIPVGDVLQRSSILKDVVARGGKNMPALIDEWRDFHRQRMEPISTYSIEAKYGRALYVNQIEKQLVARYVTGPSGIIRSGDTVVIPEGSSAFYVGMAMAAQKVRATIISSNSPLSREYRDNPMIARSLKSFLSIGGEIDYDIDCQRSENGGVYGEECLLQYRRAIKHKPGATVVVMPVTGLLPIEGPFAGDDQSNGVKREVILNAIEAGVRKLIFLTDYTKILPSREAQYGAPVLAEDHWERLLAENGSRIAIVTCPPPLLRKSLIAHSDADIRRRDPRNMPDHADFDDVCWEYSIVAPKLDGALRKGKSREKLHEACV